MIVPGPALAYNGAVKGVAPNWHLTPAEAVALQRRLATAVITTGGVKDVRLVAGADISVPRGSTTGRAAVVVLSYPALELVEVATATAVLTFPYVPGLLSFREAPLVLATWAKLKHKPGLLFVDGQGIAHPRRLGIASHLGLLLDMPAIGCAKSRLWGEDAAPGAKAGSMAPLCDRGEVIGMVLRTKDNVKPLYISVGHKLSLPDAVAWVERCLRGYRLPEPTRLAHLAAGGNLPAPVL